VVAAVLMGDPRFTKGMPFNKGTAKGTGVSRALLNQHIPSTDWTTSNSHMSCPRKLRVQRTPNVWSRTAMRMTNSAIVCPYLLIRRITCKQGRLTDYLRWQERRPTSGLHGEILNGSPNLHQGTAGKSRDPVSSSSRCIAVFTREMLA
jgi:hypothetical protein